MERSYMTLIFGVTFNMVTMLGYYIFLNEKHHGTTDVVLDDVHVIMFWTSIVIFLMCLPLFILSVTMDPGYLKPTYDYTKLVDVALDIGLHMDNFCSYCEVIKSETSFHCTICNRCVELFDHHCPFINNCLGYRNHKYFLSFIFLYTVYLMILLFETFRHFVEIYQVEGISCLHTDMWCTINIVLITLHLPVFFFQYYQQCGNLCKKPFLPPAYV